MLITHTYYRLSILSLNKKICNIISLVFNINVLLNVDETTKAIQLSITEIRLRLTSFFIAIDNSHILL